MVWIVMASTVWKSDATIDYWMYQVTDEEILAEAEDFGIDIEEYTDETTGEIDIESIRNQIVDSDYDADYEDLKMNVAPAIAKECPSDYLWVVGDYQRWDGARAALKCYTDAEQGVMDLCYPEYDSISELFYDSDGNLSWTEYTHDAPMGGTHMTFYRFKDQNTFDEFDRGEYEDPNDIAYYGKYYYGEVDYACEDPDVVRAWIEQGILVPIKSLSL